MKAKKICKETQRM